jgi:cbb3-type cytochrome oxidase subunit 3
MYKTVLKYFPLPDLVVAGQLLFFFIFLGALLWVFRRGSKEFYARLANIPLEEGKHE